MLLVSACESKLNEAQQDTRSLEQIQESGKIRIGYRQSQPPMSFVGPDGMPAGYSIDISKEIVAEIEKRIGEKINVRRFVRYELGEGIQKKTADLAADVAAMVADS